MCSSLNQSGGWSQMRYTDWLLLSQAHPKSPGDEDAEVNIPKPSGLSKSTMELGGVIYRGKPEMER